MAVEVIYTGPKPASGEKWCMVCAYTWKGAANEMFADKIKESMELPEGGDPVLVDTTDAQGLPPLFAAVATGLYAPLMHMGPMDLCWSHLNAIQLKSAGGLHLPAPGQGMGLMGPGMNGRG